MSDDSLMRLVFGWGDRESPPSGGCVTPCCAARLRNVFRWLRSSRVVLLWMALVSLPQADSFQDNINWIPLRYIQFDTGDKISCKLAQKFQALGSVYAPGLEHWLLAYDTQHLVDIEPNSSLTETLVAIKHVSSIDHYQECVHQRNEKLPPNMIKEMVDVAVGRVLYYNLMRCNCKHYVHYWATGTQGGSIGQISFLPPSRKCVYVLEVNTPPFLNRETVIPAISPRDQPQNIQNYLPYSNNIPPPDQPQNIQNYLPYSNNITPRDQPQNIQNLPYYNNIPPPDQPQDIQNLPYYNNIPPPDQPQDIQNYSPYYNN